jgi:hypothetical protein
LSALFPHQFALVTVAWADAISQSVVAAQELDVMDAAGVREDK